jgi:hypothetical protein
MKNIMKAAHKMAKEIRAEFPEVNYSFQLGLCISYLAKEGENEMVKLKGSEKQTKWAEEIRKEMIESVDMSSVSSAMAILRKSNDFISKAKLRSTTDKNKNNEIMIELVKEIIENETSAVKFIENQHLLSFLAETLA